jgi:hypothetical protein
MNDIKCTIQVSCEEYWKGSKRKDFVCAHYGYYLRSDGGEVVIMKGIFWQLIIILVFQNLLLI